VLTQFLLFSSWIRFTFYPLIIDRIEKLLPDESTQFGGVIFAGYHGKSRFVLDHYGVERWPRARLDIEMGPNGHQGVGAIHELVPAGDLIAEITNTQSESLVRQARLQMEAAQSDFERADRSFHAGIQRKQIRLERDLVDDTDDLRNPPRRLLDLIHRTDGTMHDLSALLGIGLGHGHDGVGFDRTLGGAPNRRSSP